MRQVRRWVAVLGFAVVASLTVWVSPADAHSVRVEHGYDAAWLDAGHDYLTVEDRECDSNGVYAQGYTSSGQYRQVWDENGCRTGGNWVYGPNFSRFRVCEYTVGCSGWRYTS